MTEPKTIPDFGSDKAAIDKRSQYIKDNADCFTVMNGYQRMGEYPTLFDARGGARLCHAITKRTIMIYAVYGPYDTWVENYDGKTDNHDKETKN